MTEKEGEVDLSRGLDQGKESIEDGGRGQDLEKGEGGSDLANGTETGTAKRMRGDPEADQEIVIEEEISTVVQRVPMIISVPFSIQTKTLKWTRIKSRKNWN